MCPKFSVAMCTYNGARFVKEQLASIASQTRPPDELVVCDDGSSDATIEYLHEFARNARFAVRIVVNEETLGSTRNFDQAIAFTDGDFIAFSDQDDVWMPQKLENIEKALIKGAAFAFTNGEIVDSSLKPLGRSVWQAARFGEREQRQFANGGAFELLVDRNVVTGAAMAFRAEYKDLIQPIPDGLVHDGLPVLHDGWTAILLAAVSDVTFIDERLFQYRQHEQQQMGVKPLNSAVQPGMFDSRRASFQTELSYLSTILARLADHTDFHVHAGVMERLRSHIRHLESRISLPRERASRIAPVARELFSRRYHRYSNGLSSAAKDMLVRS